MEDQWSHNKGLTCGQRLRRASVRVAEQSGIVETINGNVNETSSAVAKMEDLLVEDGNVTLTIRLIMQGKVSDGDPTGGVLIVMSLDCWWNGWQRGPGGWVWKRAIMIWRSLLVQIGLFADRQWIRMSDSGLGR